MRRATTIGALGIVLALGGCGASDPQEGATIKAPTSPSAADCGFRARDLQVDGGTDGRASTKMIPHAGAYRYGVTGHLRVPGSGVRVKDLPSRAELLVTPPRRHGGLVCFRVQKRFAADVANTSTYVIRNKDVYLISLRIEALGESQEIRPSPAVLSVSGAGSQWAGQFGGATRGSYAFSGLGKRTFRVQSRRLSGVGVSSVVSYRGGVNGVQKSTAWITPRYGLVLFESFRSRQSFGVNSLHLDSRSHLLSLQPARLPKR